MKGVVLRLSGFLGGLIIGAPLLGVCAVVSLPLTIISPRKGEAVFYFGLSLCEPFIELMQHP